MLRFEKEVSSKITSSLISSEPEFLKLWATDVSVSHVFEKAMLSAKISQEEKIKLIRAFRGVYCDLAKDKFGSHIIDKFWAIADLGQKVGFFLLASLNTHSLFQHEIAQELLRERTTLINNNYGKFVVRNCKLDQYDKKLNEWTQKQKGAAKKRSMFDDIIEEAEQIKKRKKEEKEIKKQVELDSVFYPTDAAEEADDEKPRMQKVAKNDDSMDTIMSAIKKSKKVK